MPRVTFVGAGNVASQIAERLHSKGYFIELIISKSGLSAQKLASKLDAKWSTNLKDISPITDIVLIASSDDSLIDILTNMPKHDQCVLHTSGSSSISLLDKWRNHGILYPLFSFKKQRLIEWANVPFLIEANNSKTQKQLEILVSDIGSKLYYASSIERLKYHLAAVFVNNFSNKMYDIANRYLEEENLQFEVVKPILQQTAEIVKTVDPQNAQTGPALRNDLSTIEKHTNLLAPYPQWNKIYSLLTELINQGEKSE